tara:strand:- start:4918 stop:5055 length:138 start_codon:yes stop_codon:yes gene_type:complete
MPVAARHPVSRSAEAERFNIMDFYICEEAKPIYLHYLSFIFISGL